LIGTSVVLAFDVFAERRGAEYVTAIMRGGRNWRGGRSQRRFI